MTQSDEGGDFTFPIEEALQRYARAGLPVHHATFLVRRNNVLHYNFPVESDSPTAKPGTLDLEVLRTGKVRRASMVELSRGTDVFHAQQVENSRWIRTALRARPNKSKAK
jgi:hypothetical protein